MDLFGYQARDIAYVAQALAEKLRPQGLIASSNEVKAVWMEMGTGCRVRAYFNNGVN